MTRGGSGGLPSPSCRTFTGCTGTSWPGAREIRSQSRHVNFSRTVWITFQRRGITSSVSVTSSPIFDNRSDPQHAQDVGPGTTTRSRGRCSGKGLRDGLRWTNPLTSVVRAAGDVGRRLVLGGARSELVEREFQLVEKTLLALGPPAVQRATQLLDHQGQGGDLRLGRRRSCLGRHECSLQPLSVVRIGGGHGQQRITGAAARQFLTGFAHVSHGQAKLNRPATGARSEPGCASRSLPTSSRAAPQ